MKILLLCDRLEAGGAETHVVTLARGLKALGVSVTVASGGGRLWQTLLDEGFSGLFLPLPTHRPLQLLLARKRIKQAVQKERFAILHAHTRLSAFLLRGAHRWKTTSGTHPLVLVTVHARFRTTPLFRRLSYWGNYTTAVSADLKAYLTENYRLRRQPIEVIGNGIDLARFCAEEDAKRIPFSVLFASRLDADCSRGAHLLLDAFPSLYRQFPLTLTIAGGGSEMSALQQRVDLINASLPHPAVFLTGYREDMGSLYREHMIFVGVSRTALEAAACGCAVVLCGNEGYGGILSGENAPHHAHSNFCARGDDQPTEACLLKDLQILLSSPTLFRSVQAGATDYIQKNCNAHLQCKRTLFLYRRLASFPLPKKILLGGYFGCGNLGDDAMLMGSLEELRRQTPVMLPAALTGKGRLDQKQFGISCYSRKNIFSLCMAFCQADLFLLGGGSLLQSLSSTRSLWYYLLLLRLARLWRCQIVLFANGLGPFQSKKDLLRVAKALSRLPYVSLRDPLSLAMLRQAGVPKQILHIGADPGLLFPIAKDWRSHPTTLSKKPHWVLVMRRAEEKQLSLLSACLRIAKQNGDPLPIVTALCREDESIAQSFAQNHLLPFHSLNSPCDAVSLIGQAYGVVSLRLHGLVFSALTGVPALGISFSSGEEKLAAFAASAGQTHLYGKDLTPALLLQAVKSALASPQSKEKVSQLQKKVKLDLANILDLVYNNK